MIAIDMLAPQQKFVVIVAGERGRVIRPPKPV